MWSLREIIKTHTCLSFIILHIPLFCLLNKILDCTRFIFCTQVTAARVCLKRAIPLLPYLFFENLDSILGCVTTQGKVIQAHLVKLVIA